MQIIDDFLQFFFPNLCVVCSRILSRNEKVLCSECTFHIPRTDFHKEQNNPVSQLFWGRTRIENAASFFYFNKGSSYQTLIHKLKYNGRSDIGIEMGKLYGAELRNSHFSSAGVIIPVPLHRSKLKKRGYNQSEKIAEGLSGSLGLPLKTNCLLRLTATQTQTRKARFERFKNVEGKFIVQNESEITGKHILLVDDVVTTGSTLEASAQAILEIPGTRVSILTLATA